MAQEHPSGKRANGLSARIGRGVFVVLGFAMLALAVIGALLPVMPSTIFVILAAGCFARSSPRFEAWLLDHPRFGPTLRAWRAEGAIAPRAKLMASGGMALGFVLFLAGAHPHWPATVAVGAFLAACALYVVTRPRPRQDG